MFRFLSLLYVFFFYPFGSFLHPSIIFFVPLSLLILSCLCLFLSLFMCLCCYFVAFHGKFMSHYSFFVSILWHPFGFILSLCVLFHVLLLLFTFLYCFQGAFCPSVAFPCPFVSFPCPAVIAKAAFLVINVLYCVFCSSLCPLVTRLLHLLCGIFIHLMIIFGQLCVHC